MEGFGLTVLFLFLIYTHNPYWSSRERTTNSSASTSTSLSVGASGYTWLRLWGQWFYMVEIMGPVVLHGTFEQWGHYSSSIGLYPAYISRCKEGLEITSQMNRIIIFGNHSPFLTPTGHLSWPRGCQPRGDGHFQPHQKVHCWGGGARLNIMIQNNTLGNQQLSYQEGKPHQMNIIPYVLYSSLVEACQYMACWRLLDYMLLCCSISLQKSTNPLSPQDDKELWLEEQQPGTHRSIQVWR